MRGKWWPLVLSLILALAMSPLASLAQTDGPNRFSDMPDDWSTQALENAVKHGLLFGSNGKILPKQHLKRAELAAIINRAFGARAKAPLDRFTDVAETSWYYDDMAKAVKMKTFQGHADQLRPEDPVTREEAFAVIARAIKLPVSEEKPSGFSDLNDISSWARGEVFSLIHAGYVKGANGQIRPKSPISRAEFAQLMDNIIKVYIRQAGVYHEVAEGNVMVNVPGVTLKDLTVKGDLILGDGVGDGDVVLDNVEVSGRLIVRGGGENSIVIRGESKISTVIVAKVDGAVRVFAEDGAEVEAVHIDDGDDRVILEGTIGTVIIQAALPVELTDARVQNVVVEAQQAELTIGSGSTVENVVIDNTAAAAVLQVEGTVGNITVEAPKTSIGGTGTVQNVVVKHGADDTKIETENTRIVIEEGVRGTTGVGGVPLEAGEHNSSPPADSGTQPVPSPGGSSPPAPIPLEAVNVTGDAVVGATLTAEVTPSGATVNFQWQRADAEDGEYTDIHGATGKTYKLVAADAGKYIRVKAAGTGGYTGTAESRPVGPVEPDPDTETPKRNSTYKFSYHVPADAAARTAVVVPVTFATEEKGDKGYDAVRFKFAAQGPGDVTFTARDSDNVEHTFTNTGYWGPAGGFDLPAEYSATTNWTLRFSAAGEYTVTFSLIQADTGEVVAGMEESVTITVAEPPPGEFGNISVTTKKHGSVDGYIIDIRLADGATFERARVEVSLVDANSNVLQKNTLKADHGLTSSSLTVPFDVKGSFDYAADGFWIVEGSVKGNYEAPAKAVITVTLANGKELVAELTNITPVVQEYHTYKFNIANQADRYIVRNGLANPSDSDFVGFTPVKLSIAVDHPKDKPYEGNVRVAPVGANHLQLWAKDTNGKWHDINRVGWGPASGFPINTEAVTDVYVIATDEMDGYVTLILVDIDGNYGAADNIVIRQQLAVYAVTSQVADALDAINGAGDGAEMLNALNTHAAALGLNFGSLTDGGRRLAVADSVNFVKEVYGEYQRAADIKAAFDQAVQIETRKMTFIRLVNESDAAAAAASLTTVLAEMMADAQALSEEFAPEVLDNYYGEGFSDNLREAIELMKSYLALDDDDKKKVAEAFIKNEYNGSFTVVMGYLLAAMQSL